MRPQVVQIVSKPSGLAWIWGTITGLVVLAIVVFIGVIIGMAFGFGIAGGASGEEFVVQRTYRDGGSKTVAIIPIINEIDDRQAEFAHAAVDHVLKDKSISAVVLRVDSPGGGVSASDQIWYELNRLHDKGIPVVASYGGVAASGGYYVSCGSDYIMAEETCITGSIGVIAQVLTLEGLMDKVGVKPVTLVATGSPEKDVANDMFRTWNDRDKAKIRTMLDSAYATFHKRVQDGRKNAISPGALDAIANGSIYTAQQAKDNGVVDAIGYLDNAIAKAESLGGVATGRSTVVMIRKPPSLFGDGFLAESKSPRGGSIASLDGDGLRSMVNNLASPRVMYLMH